MVREGTISLATADQTVAPGNQQHIVQKADGCDTGCFAPDHLGIAREINGVHLVGGDVEAIQMVVMPAWRLAEDQTSHKRLYFRHRTTSSSMRLIYSPYVWDVEAAPCILDIAVARDSRYRRSGILRVRRAAS